MEIYQLEYSCFRTALHSKDKEICINALIQNGGVRRDYEAMATPEQVKERPVWKVPS